ncbi:MAG: hypothetical protein U1F51_01805 [Burkholderiales bacterium]
MTFLLLLIALALPAILGIAILALVSGREAETAGPGVSLCIAGAGIAVGVFAVTLVLRALAAASIPFGFVSAATPVAIAAIVLATMAMRGRGRATRVALNDVARTLLARDHRGFRRVAWLGAVAWIALHAALLFAEVAVRPVYAWDAWSAWATKAKTWFAMGTLVPFTDAAGWASATTPTWFDARPTAPATAPLMQVWVATVLGRWDDALANLTGWLCYVAIVLTVAGETRRRGASAAAALASAWLVASLPLLGTQVALAGYADLPLTMFATVGALAGFRAFATRAPTDVATAIVALVAAIATKESGWVWVVVFAPGFAAAALGPRRYRSIGIALAVVALVVVGVSARGANLAWTHGLFAYDPLGPQFLAESVLYANWHLLAPGLLAAGILGGRRIASPEVAPLGFALLAGALWIAALVAFPVLRYFGADALGIQRAILVLVPLAVVWMVDVSGVGRERTAMANAA